MKVLILGSGGLKIGQAGEFDYSGSQAIKALKEEKHRVVLINPNIATVQTDYEMADRVYLQPLNVDCVTRIIEKERPDALLLNVGGQTALNLGLELEEKGILKQFAIQVLGTSTDVIRITEDRKLFKEALDQIGVRTPNSISVNSTKEALEASSKIGFPLMMRSGFSLGGLGSGKIENEQQLLFRAQQAFSTVPQILLEEYLEGWKEIEYEIVRDIEDNTLIVCNMENMDPMGVHTGESIVVAPSQTLTNQEFHELRTLAMNAARHLGIIGECNIQFAIDPKNGSTRVIEMNARLSRSSALASKATGYPIAFVATKLCLGKTLREIPNSVTKTTQAYFEPALDYIVVKIPRWDIHKLRSADRKIGSEMKSVGEVMAIGRSFSEALQKAIRMLNIGADSLLNYPYHFNKPEKEIESPTDRRLFALASFFASGGSVEKAQKLSHIDLWFLRHIYHLTHFELSLKNSRLSRSYLLEAKQLGFSDKTIALAKGKKETEIRKIRINKEILPSIKQIDTLAGEFAAETNYLYLTYHGTHSDIEPSKNKPIVVLGSGPYCIGSSVEFDWCAVNTIRTLRSYNESTIMVNSNPETVSTDYDESDRLYFEELTLERVQDIADFESPKGLIVSVGGQISNNLALPLYKAGYPIIGTSPLSIDQAENRQKFSTLLNNLGIDQPTWSQVTTLKSARDFAKNIGYPVLVRPSYVLSGSAMNIIFNDNELTKYLEEATLVSQDYPVVMSQFIQNAKELEVDAVADQGEIVIDAISEHIENAGIHSGDATIVLPPHRLYLDTIRKTKQITKAIAKALNITGPFNIQFIASNQEIKVIECNVRCARSFPFVSKVTGQNFMRIATEVFLGKHQKKQYETLELDYVGVKSPQFSYSRLKGANPVAHVEMASTGEVAVIGETLLDSFLLSWQATDQQITNKRLLITIGGDKKSKLLPSLIKLEEQGWDLYATENTHTFLYRQGVGSTFLFKASESFEPNVLTYIAEKKVDLIINIPRSLPTETQDSDGFKIRRLAIDHYIPLITNLQLAQILLKCLTEVNLKKVPIKSWQEIVLS